MGTILFSLYEESYEPTEMSLGTRLERRRRELGLSLEDVSEKTRIVIPYLENIDRDEFHRLPGLPYSRGFVQSYASCVGLDTDTVVEQFNSEVGLGAS